jgi:glycosyltransferase involved in cell wall biosynthesis
MSALDLGARPASTTNSATAHATPTVSVIVPHFNDLANLRACLALLQAQTLPADEFEIIVADNNSTVGLDAVRAACGERTIVVNAPIQGAAAARNTGVEASRGRILAFIDSDCRPAPDWLTNGVAALSQADMVGGQVETSVDDDANMTPSEAFEMVFAFNNRRYVEGERFSVTANMFVSRAVFDKVGGFRAAVSEDKDWGQRAARLGFRWAYAPDVRVTHPARHDFAELRSKWRRITRETCATERQKPLGTLRFLLRSWALLLSPLPHAVHILGSSKLRRLRDKINAIGILFRIRWWRFLESHRILLSN